MKFRRRRFSPGTKGARGVCSARGCIRNARTMHRVAMGYHYGWGHVMLARCELHPFTRRLR